MILYLNFHKKAIEILFIAACQALVTPRIAQDLSPQTRALFILTLCCAVAFCNSLSTAVLLWKFKLCLRNSNYELNGKCVEQQIKMT